MGDRDTSDKSRGMSGLSGSPDETIVIEYHPDHDGVSEEQRTYAAAAHGSMIILQIFGPLAVWYLKKDSSFIRDNAREAVNFYITFLLSYIGLSIIVSIAGEGRILTWALMAYAVAMVMVAMLKAYSGKPYHYPVSFQFITEQTKFSLPQSSRSQSFNFGDLLEFKFEKFYMVYFVSILYRISVALLFLATLVNIAIVLKVPSPESVGVPIDIDIVLFKIIAIIVCLVSFFLSCLVLRAILELYCVMFRIYDNSVIVADEFAQFKAVEGADRTEEKDNG